MKKGQQLSVLTLILLLSMSGIVLAVPEDIDNPIFHSRNDLNDLDDVNITSPVDLQLLLYNQSSDSWYNSYLNDSVHLVNASDNWNTDIGSLSTVNATEMENNGGTLSIVISWLNGAIGDVACLLTGCTMEGNIDMDNNNILDIGDLEVNNNISIGGQVNVTGNVIIQDRLFVGIDPSETNSIINPGDAAFRGNLAVVNGTLSAISGRYGASGLFFNHGANNPDKASFHLDFTGNLNVSTELFCDFTDNPFKENDTLNSIFVLFSAEFSTNNVFLAINSFENSSCVFVETRIFGDDDVTQLTTVSYVIAPQPVFGILDNGVVINGVRKYFNTDTSSEQFGSYIRENTLQDKPGGNLFADAFTNDNGDLEYVFGTQTGLNNSGNFFRNSLGIWSTTGYNTTQKQDLNFLHNIESRWSFINVTPFLDYFSSESGADLAVEGGIETQKVFIHDDLGNGELLGEGLFQWILRAGEHFNIIGGGMHIREEKIKEFGFPLGANITNFFEDFEMATLDKFELITSGKGVDEWAVDADIFGDCPTVDESFICIHAGPTGGSGDTVIQTNLTTIDLELNNLDFFINTFDMSSGGDFEIIMNNNIGSGDVSIYSTSIDVLDQRIITTIPSSMDDQILVTMEFVFSSSHPIRGDTWIDQITINATTIASSLQNISVQDGIIKFGDERCFISQEVINEDLDQEMNISCDNINLIGDVTAISITEITLNVTDSITVANNITLGSGATLWSNATCTFLASPDGSTVLEVCNA